MSPVSKEPIVLSVVSGKGGVGKTLLSSSLAACVASGEKTVLLIDLDLDNQGLTSWLAAHYKIPESTQGWFPVNSNADPEFNILRLKKFVYFLPAPASGKTKEEYRDKEIALKFEKIMELLLNRARKMVDVIIIDCHGSSDSLTSAAVSASDRVLFVSEPDPITFGGSLQWLSEMREQGCHEDLSRKILFVVNRVPPKFQVGGLRDIIRDTLGRAFLEDKTNQIDLYCFPSEAAVKDLFGKVPFIYDVVLSTLFRSKVDLLTFCIFRDLECLSIIPRRIFRRYSKSWRRRLIYNRIDTLEAFVRRHMLGVGVVFGVSTTLFGIFIIFQEFYVGIPFQIWLMSFATALDFQDHTSFNNIAFVVSTALFYGYFSYLWVCIFLYYFCRTRVSFIVMEISSGSLRVWSGISFFIYGFIACSIFPLALALTLITAIFVIFTPFYFTAS